MKLKLTKPVIAWLKSFFSLLGIIILAFVATNFGYFQKQWEYYVAHDLLNQEIKPEEEFEVGEANRLVIESLGINAPIVYVDEQNEAVFQKALADGVVHYPGTAQIGESGNVFIFGHSSDFASKPGTYKTVFALLPRIKEGEVIKVTDPKGRLYTYTVSDTLVVRPTETEVLSQGDKEEKLLTLQTSYPVGTALKRFIVKARLAS